MLPPVAPTSPNVTTTTSEPRVTPVAPKTRFGEVMKNTILAGADMAAHALPGGPLVALALRSSTGSANSGRSAMLGTSQSALTSPASSPGAQPMASSAEGPKGTGDAAGGAAPVGAGMDSALAQSQEMNLYYLQVQEQVNAQNRNFTTLSNVLKAEHETVKTAIGNIR
jgi:hypothetical protein